MITADLCACTDPTQITFTRAEFKARMREYQALLDEHNSKTHEQHYREACERWNPPTEKKFETSGQLD